MKTALFLLLFLLLPVSNAYTEEELRYLFPILDMDDIDVRLVDMKYVTWEGLYTPYTIQINTRYAQTDREQYWTMVHELMHHYCWTLFDEMDFKHVRCFR